VAGGFRLQAEDQRLVPDFHLKVEATRINFSQDLQPGVTTRML
jgi:hypothetical protein